LDYEDTSLKNVASSYQFPAFFVIRLHDAKDVLKYIVSSCDNGTSEYKFMPWLILRTELLPSLYFYDNPHDILIIERDCVTRWIYLMTLMFFNLQGHSKLFTILYNYNFLFASLPVLTKFKMLTETRLKIPCVIGRCSLVPNSHWLQRK
jgi:hypothetical protein